MIPMIILMYCDIPLPICLRRHLSTKAPASAGACESHDASRSDAGNSAGEHFREKADYHAGKENDEETDDDI